MNTRIIVFVFVNLSVYSQVMKLSSWQVSSESLLSEPGSDDSRGYWTTLPISVVQEHVLEVSI